MLPAALDVSDYYRDPAHSVADPARLRAYEDAMRPWNATARTVEAMADHYRTAGKAADALCVATWLDHLAGTAALTGQMATNQATYVQGWLLGAFAIAWLKVRIDPAIPGPQRGRVADWLGKLASSNLNYYASRAGKEDGRNNHRYWAGLAVVAAGIAGDREDLFNWGIASFRVGVSQVTPEGTLPLEMGRQARALHYHLFAAAPLVTIAELASANGIDLYHETGDALIRLVRRAVSGIEDPSFFADNAGIAQEPVKLGADDIAWVAPFARRFPDPGLTALLARASSRSMLYIGGLPP
jgi:poly(beta-D-mannuronate) lyase